MKRIISIQGGMAGGKTTLANALEENLTSLHVFYENPYPIVQQRSENKLDIYTETGFVENQKLFIQAEVERFKNLPDGNILLDRGPEDIEFYTLHFPVVNGFNWSVEVLLETELRELRECRSDTILYLDATRESLIDRKNADLTRKRNSFDHHLNLLALEKTWYGLFDLQCIDTNSKSIEDVQEEAIRILISKGFI